MGLWTTAHAVTLIPTLAVMLFLSWLLWGFLGNKDLRLRMIPLRVIAVLLVILEIGKQAVSLSRGYDLYHLPFHFCSLFIFSVPGMAFYRGKHAAAVCEVTGAWCSSLFLLMLIYPNLIYSAWDVEHYVSEYMAFHTVTFHNLVMLAAILIPVLRLDGEGGKHRGAVLRATCGFCGVSAAMAQLLKTNYANFYSCNIPVFETVRTSLRESIGPVLTQLLYVLIVATLTILFVWMAYELMAALRRWLGRIHRQRTVF